MEDVVLLAHPMLVPKDYVVVVAVVVLLRSSLTYNYILAYSPRLILIHRYPLNNNWPPGDRNGTIARHWPRTHSNGGARQSRSLTTPSSAEKRTTKTDTHQPSERMTRGPG